MSVKETLEELETELEYQRDDVSAIIDELEYEKAWDDRDDAVRYANQRLSETCWRDYFNSKENAVRHYVLREQLSPDSTVSPPGPPSPF